MGCRMENVSPTLAVIELTGLSFCNPFKEVLLGSRPRSIQAIATGWIRCDKVQQAQYCVIRSVTTTFNDIDITPNSTLFEVDNQSLDNVGMLPAVKESAYKNNTEITSVKNSTHVRLDVWFFKKHTSKRRESIAANGL